jgi:hypothetical protein
MSSGVLNGDKKCSEVIESKGGLCHISLEGEGPVSITRSLGAEFQVMTTDNGVPLTFVGDGVLFNNSVKVGRNSKIRIEAETPSSVKYIVQMER